MNEIMPEPPFLFSDRGATIGLDLTLAQDLDSASLMRRLITVPSGLSGAVSMTVLGRRLGRDVETLLRLACVALGYSEISLPLLQRTTAMSASGRLQRFESEIYRVDDSTILSPTFEELYIDLISKVTLTTSGLPVKLFQIGPKFRRVMRPKGALRLSVFNMVDMFSISTSDSMAKGLAREFEAASCELFEFLGVEVVRKEEKSGRYVDFVMPCPGGETRTDSYGPTKTSSSRPDLDSPATAGTSLGMYMQLGNDDGFPAVRCADERGVAEYDFFGSYGFGVERLIHGIVHSSLTATRIEWPAAVRPFDVAVLRYGGRHEKSIDTYVAELAELLSRNGVRVVVDDRRQGNLRTRTGALQFLGPPLIMIVGEREAVHGTVTLRDSTSSRTVGRDEATVLALAEASARRQSVRALFDHINASLAAERL